MNRTKGKGKDLFFRATAVLTAVLLLAGMPGASLTGQASNSLGSQGSALTGDQGSQSEAQDQQTGSEVDQIVSENDEGIAGSSASRVRVTQSSVRVRGDASTGSAQVGSLTSGDEMDVVGETTGSDGNLWYQISGEKDGKAVNGYVRSDLVEVIQTASPEAPAETPSEPQPEAPEAETPVVSSDDYAVSYADDGTGNNDWYLNDNISGTRYKISELLGAAATNESNIKVMDEQTGSLRMIIIVLAVIIGLLVVVVTIMIFKLRSVYDEEDGYYSDEDEDEDEDEEDEEDEEDDEEEDDDWRGRRRGFAGRRTASSTAKRRYEEDDEDEEEEDEDERYGRNSRRTGYRDEEDEEDEEYYEDSRRRNAGRKAVKQPASRSVSRSSQSQGRPSRSEGSSRRKAENRNYPARNFLEVDDDDDMDFEFLDLK